MKNKEEKKEFAPFLEWDLICRVKGKQGLFVQITSPNKSNMIGLREFLTKNTITTNILNVERLGNFKVFTEDKELSLSEVMYNISENEKLKKRKISKLKINSAMKIMAPDYDSEQFKTYHAEKILKWYEIINKKLQDVEKN